MSGNDDMATRFVGFCPVCEGTFKLHKGNLVHHGYQRPGDGYIHGDCFTVGMEPHEISPKAAQLFKAECEEALLAAKARLAKLQSGEVKELYESNPWAQTSTTFTPERTVVRNAKGEEKVTTGNVAEYNFKQALERAIGNVESRIRSLESHIARMVGHLTDWAPKALLTWEESVSALKAQREATKGTRTAARQAKIAAKVASYQKRIDSAMKRVGGKNGEATLSDIWESTHSHWHDLGFKAQSELLALIDRPAVWAKFNLVADQAYRTPGYEANAKILQTMRWGDR